MKNLILVLAVSASSNVALAKALVGTCEFTNGAQKSVVPLNIDPHPENSYGAALIGQVVGPFKIGIQMGNSMTPDTFGRFLNDRVTISVETAGGRSSQAIPTLAFTRGEAVEVTGALPGNRGVFIRCLIGVK